MSQAKRKSAGLNQKPQGSKTKLRQRPNAVASDLSQVGELGRRANHNASQTQTLHEGRATMPDTGIISDTANLTAQANGAVLKLAPLPPISKGDDRADDRQ